MRSWSPSLHGVPIAGRIAYIAVVVLCVALAGIGLLDGPLFLTIAAMAMLVMFLFAAPFVLAARWRKAPPQATRRPVVRRRRH